MAKHIHVHLAPRKTKDAGTSWIEDWKQLLQVGKTYLINGRKGKVLEQSMGGVGNRTPMKKVQWLDATKDAAPSDADKMARIRRLVSRFKVSEEIARQSLVSEKWDEEAAAIDLADYVRQLKSGMRDSGYEVVWTGRDYTTQRKAFRNTPTGSPDEAERKARNFAKTLEASKEVRSVRVASIDAKDAINHLGEQQYRTYAAWKTACKAANPAVVFEGNAEICNAKPGVGEWDGETGVVYKKG